MFEVFDHVSVHLFAGVAIESFLDELVWVDEVEDCVCVVLFSCGVDVDGEYF